MEAPTTGYWEVRDGFRNVIFRSPDYSAARTYWLEHWEAISFCHIEDPGPVTEYDEYDQSEIKC